VAETPHQQAVHFAEENIAERRIYSHSNLFYWWPVWAVGYVMAFLTWFNGGAVSFGNHTELVAQAGWIGVVFTVVLLLVIGLGTGSAIGATKGNTGAMC